MEIIFTKINLYIVKRFLQFLLNTRSKSQGRNECTIKLIGLKSILWIWDTIIFYVVNMHVPCVFNLKKKYSYK